MKKKIGLFIFSALIIGVSFFLLQSRVNVLQAQTAVEFADDELVLEFKTPMSKEAQKQVVNSMGASVKQNESPLSKIRALTIKVPKGKIIEYAEKFRKSAFIASAEPNYIARPQGITNDPRLSEQWNLYQIVAAKNSDVSGWDKTVGSALIKVAVVDTGIESNHPDLSGKVVAEANFSSSSTTDDVVGHGTHVAGIVAAQTNNGIGVAGVGFNTSLLNVKVINDSGYGYYDGISNGIIWAADNGAKVINLSLGGSQPQKVLEDAVNYAWGKGVVVVAASGNSGSSSPLYPAYYTNVIATGATDKNDKWAGFANYGSWVDVAAPGDSILSTYKGDQYQLMTGTSMAAPHVSGLAALVWAVDDCGALCVRTKIEKSADPIEGTGTYWTYGRINVLKAVEYNLSISPTPTTLPPAVTPTPTISPTITLIPTVILTTTPTPTTLPSQDKILTVNNLEMWSSKVFNWWDIYARVTVLDNNNVAVSGATVSLRIKIPSGTVYSGSSQTNSQGQVTFVLRRMRQTGNYVSEITNVSKTSFTYQPSLITKTLTVQ